MLRIFPKATEYYNKKLFEAARVADRREMYDLISRRASLHAQDEKDGLTPLMILVRDKEIDVLMDVYFFALSGYFGGGVDPVDVTIRNHAHETLGDMMEQIAADFPPQVEGFFKELKATEVRQDRLNVALRQYVEDGATDNVWLYLHKGADPDARDRNGMSARILAGQRGSMEMLDHMAKHRHLEIVGRLCLSLEKQERGMFFALLRHPWVKLEHLEDKKVVALIEGRSMSKAIRAVYNEVLVNKFTQAVLEEENIVKRPKLAQQREQLRAKREGNNPSL